VGSKCHSRVSTQKPIPFVSLLPTSCIIVLFMNRNNLFFMLLIINHLDIYLQLLWFWYINHSNEKYKKKRIKISHFAYVKKIMFVSLNKYPYVLRFYERQCRRYWLNRFLYYIIFILSQRDDVPALDIINFMNVNMPGEYISLILLFLWWEMSILLILFCY